MLIISSFLTVVLVGFSMGGLMVSRRAFPEQFMFFSVGFIFFVFSFIGIILGGFMESFFHFKVVSVIIGLVCLCIIGYLLWKYDNAFGYIKQDDLTFWWIFAFLFVLFGIEFAILEISKWFIILFTFIFIGIVYSSCMLIYRLVNRHLSHPIFIILPLFPLFCVALFKIF